MISDTSLEALVRVFERVKPGMRGSVLLVDDDGVTMRHAAAPSLPDAYCQLIDGQPMGPVAGSCGTAAYRRQRVIVSDIATDPLWANYKEVAAPFGLAACWSTPILDPEGRVLGTFAMYYDEPREPAAPDIELSETATQLAANIIMGARAMTALRGSEQKLRSSQERLHAALDASSTSTWRWDIHTNAVDGDDGLFRLFGVDPAAASGSFELFVSRIHPEDRQRVIDAALRSAAEGADLDEEFRILRPDGSMRWAVDKGKIVKGGDGKPLYLIGACVDITERRVHDDQLRALAESLPQLAWMTDAKGLRDWFNQRWYEYTGATVAEATGWGWSKFLHPDHEVRVVTRIRDTWKAGHAWEDTFPLRDKNGTYRWFLSRATPIYDADGNVVRWFGTSTDINELREAEAARDHALAEAKLERERLYDVFMQAPAAIAVLEGPEHRFIVTNPHYRELIGNRDVVGDALLDAFPETREQGFAALLDRVYSTGESYSAGEQIVALDRDGDGVPENFYVDFVYQPLKDAEGKTFGIVVLAVDVTTQVHARQEIAAARADAVRANKAKSEFLAAMSHDLRTPLNAIGGYADLVSDGLYGPVTEAQGKAMRRVRGAQDHLLTLINDILSFAKVEAGRVELRTTDVRVSEVVQNASTMIELQAVKKGLAFEASGGDEHAQVRADRERMTQILTNLLTNAVKFTNTGSIVVGWRVDERAVCIDVRDTGRGVPADRLAAVFEPFVQAGRSAEEQQQGVGLGLAISQQLARAMGGDLAVESTVGRGSTFTLKLPRAVDD
jgi:PAS domain S-box-containing protein